MNNRKTKAEQFHPTLYMYLRISDHSGRAVYGAYSLRLLQHRDCGFGSNLGHELVFLFLLPVWGRDVATGRSPAQGVLSVVNSELGRARRSNP
jgi:hypothetical protein